MPPRILFKTGTRTGTAGINTPRRKISRLAGTNATFKKMFESSFQNWLETEEDCARRQSNSSLLNDQFQ